MRKSVSHHGIASPSRFNQSYIIFPEFLLQNPQQHIADADPEGSRCKDQLFFLLKVYIDRGIPVKYQEIFL